jgi:hypothetical protein
MPVVLLFVGTLAAEQHSTFAAIGAGGDPPFRGWFGLEWVWRKVRHGIRIHPRNPADTATFVGSLRPSG